MRKTFLHRGVCVLAGVFALSLVDASNAALILRLDDGLGNVVTLADGDAGDASFAAGAATFIGAVGAWSVNVTTGLGDPVLGAPNYPRIDLNSVNVSGGAGGTLSLWLTQTDNLSAIDPLGFVFDIGGTTDGTVTAGAYFDAGNAAFGMGSLIADFGALGSGAFSAAGSSPQATGQGPFSITIKTTINHVGAGASSFDADLNSVPEPGTVGLMGAALLALGFIRRKRTTE